MAADVELLREAATLMRERANATSGSVRWSAGEEIEGVFCHQYGEFGWYVTGPVGSPEFEDSEQGKADASHVASWDPPVALAVAGWLETVADIWVVPSEVRHYSARASVQECAVEVARAYLRREVVSR